MGNNGTFGNFDDESKEILNHHVPIKESKIRGNIKPYIQNS